MEKFNNILFEFVGATILDRKGFGKCPSNKKLNFFPNVITFFLTFRP